MRRDPAAARRWLVWALVAAAALLWIAALVGLGGWVGGEQYAAAPPWTLPPRAAAAERLGAPEAYVEIGTRPLFTHDRRPQPFVIDTGEAVSASAPEFVLTGVLITPTLEVAIFTPGAGGEPVRLHRGEELPGRPGWRLLLLAPRQAVFATPNGRVRFELSGVDGDAAPIPVSVSVAPGRTLDAGQGALEAGVRSAEHQARIDSVRQRVAERRAQLRAGQAVSSNPTQQGEQ